MSGNPLDQAAAARLNGDDQTAISICQQVLSSEPDNADAQSLLGVSLAEIGQLDQARSLITAALNASPYNWRFLLNRSVLEEREQNITAARSTAERAAEIAPDTFEVWGRIGDLAGKQADFRGAEEALTKAVTINPNHPALLLRLAGARFEIADYVKANHALDAFEKFAPGYPDALKLRTHIARQTSDWDGLISSAKAWLAAAPQEEGARVALAFAYSQPGFHARAVEAYQPLADATPPNAFHLAAHGKYLLSARDLDKAEHYFNRALEIEPENSEALAGMGRVKTYVGAFDEAAALSRRALQSDANNVEAYAQLALATGGRISDEEIESLRQHGANEQLDLEQRALCWFAVGDANHRKKERNAAFEAWSEACRLKRKVGETEADARYDRAAHGKLVDRIIREFPEDRPTYKATPGQNPIPIFIVGMPRSGTTLLESALAAHKSLACAGELPVIPFAQREFTAWADEAGWRGGPIPHEIIEAIRQKYFDQYQEFRISNAPYVTDKQPNNFLSVGLIRHVFPEARIIHIRRNPIETGFSIFRRNFARAWQFANSLEDIAHFYGEHSRITNHWRNTTGDNMAFVQYEELVANFESELRRLIDACGLEWDPNCLEYYKEDRAVITFSAAQVRKPPSLEHLDSTSPYKEHLAPLADALSKADVNLQTGALTNAS